MNQFKAKRKGSELTQLKVAQQLGLDKSTISKWESSESFPRAELLPKLALIYNCTVDELLKIQQ